MTKETPEAAAAAPSLDDREAALAAREAVLALREREAALAAREAALAQPAVVVPGVDPAEAQRHEDRAKRRHELVEARAASVDPEERRAIARALFGHEADDLADFASDLAEHGTSLLAVLKKAAHNAFGVQL